MGDLCGSTYDTNGPRPKPTPMSDRERAEFDAWFADFRARIAQRAQPQPEKQQP